LKSIRSVSSVVVICSIFGVDLVMLSPMHARASDYETSDKLLIYCTNNYDGTGQCFRLPDYTPMSCTAVPTDVFPCTGSDSVQWNCQYYGSSQFQCKKVPRIQSGVDSNQYRDRINSIKTFPENLQPSQVGPDSLNGLPATIDGNEFR